MVIIITYSTDTSLEQIIAKGNLDQVKMDVEPFSKLDQVWLLTQDWWNLSSAFRKIKHVPCGFRIWRPLNWVLYFMRSLSKLILNRKRIYAIRAYGIGCFHAALFSRISKAPLVVSYEYEWSKQMSITGRRLTSIVAHRIEKFVLRSSSLTVALTERLGRKARMMGAGKILLLPNAVDEEYIMSSLGKESIPVPRILKNSSRKKILFVGRLHRIKRVEDLIKAVALLKGKFLISLIIIGDGEEKPGLIEIVKELGLDHSTFFMGFSKRSDVFSFMKLADVLVLPSLVEGSPRVLIEAMLCRTPIVATNVEGINDMIRHGWNGLLVEPSNPKMLAKEIEKVLTDKSLRDRIAEIAYNDAKERYSAGKNIGKQLEAISILMGQKGN